eukprot:NODE_11761_length_1266_cov_7.030729.p1 GENE.NODE_11761_length_1266_cov_7.030729~~NODE_11761_length_1266_cov_7.030729.p1  ORF type:complete len:352 (+),score=100.18 NODE_11761_length_1266_cov_7.030729:153-1208(+)
MSTNGGEHDEGRALIGEWRQVENIITIVRRGDGLLTMVADAAQPSLTLVRFGELVWAARREGHDVAVYDVCASGRESLEICKGERICRVFRLARTRTLLGEWVNNAGKLLTVAENASGSGTPVLEFRADRRRPLHLVRRQIMVWEACVDRDRESAAVYILEHSEGTDRLEIRKPNGRSAGYDAITFVRFGTGGGAVPAITATATSSAARSSGIGGGDDGGVCGSSPPLPEAPIPVARGGPKVSRGHGRRRCRKRSRSCSRNRSRSPHEADLEEFIQRNELCDRVVDSLRSLDRHEQRHVMGLDGGRNSFLLIGAVREPNAVVVSRINRLRHAALPRSQSRGRSRSRSRSFH